MNTFLFAILAFWIVAAVAFVAFVGRFRRYVERQTTVDVPAGFAAGEWPEALVIMSLRGGDESLRETLDGLATQCYPNYRIRLVIDNPDDEVNRVVRSWRRLHPQAPVSVEYLAAPLRSCTLKCSAVHQVLRDEASRAAELRPGAVVLVDADSDPYPHWLRDAVAPLAEADVGGVTGNRWYFPRSGGIAAWCRFLFTAWSLPAMWRGGFSWGGTLALRGEIACSEEFLHTFAITPTEEQTCYELLPKFGKRMYFAPQLIQWNPESIGFEGTEQHLFRQLAWSRLFYPVWTTIVAAAAVTWGAVIASLVLVGFAIADSRPLYMLPLALAVLFVATIISALARLHRTLQVCVFAAQRRELPTLNLRRTGELFVAMFATLGVYTTALVRAHFTDEIRWRGIVYRIFTDDTIAMNEYVPWLSAKATAPAKSTHVKVRKQSTLPARSARAGEQIVGS